MTPEQRAAAVERLAKAREKRARENPPAYKSVHPDVVSKPDDDALSLKKVREWIKYQKDIKATLKKAVRRNEKGALAKYTSCDGYIKNMEKYLRTSVWLDLFYGEDQQYRMQTTCVKMAYYDKGPFAGEPKRSVGTFYPDLNMVWTKEMDNEYFSKNIPKKK